MSATDGIDLLAGNARLEILRHLTLHPEKPFYGTELSRILGLSQAICSTHLRTLHDGDLLDREDIGRVSLYKVKDVPYTRELSRFFLLDDIRRSGLVRHLVQKDEDIISIILHGSSVRGTSISSSDVDIIIVTARKRDHDLTTFSDLLGRTIQIFTFSPNQWLTMSQDDDPFYQSVKQAHAVLHGGELP